MRTQSHWQQKCQKLATALKAWLRPNIPSLMKKWRLPLFHWFWGPDKIESVWPSKSHRQGPSLNWIKCLMMECSRHLFLFSLLAFSSNGGLESTRMSISIKQINLFITFRRRRSLMEGESVVSTSWHLLQPEHILFYFNKIIFIWNIFDLDWSTPTWLSLGLSLEE